MHKAGGMSESFSHFPFLSNATNFFIHSLKKFVFLKKYLCTAGFLQSSDLYANIRHDSSVNIIGRKVSIGSINGAGGSGGIPEPQEGF